MRSVIFTGEAAAMSILVRLLGPVDVRRDDATTPVGAPKRRTMLAALALSANRPVSVDTLVETLWGDDVPSSATKNIRNYALALRTLVGDRLVTQPRAYELQLGADELDATLFITLADQGTAALASGDPIGGIAAFRSALELWRGDPLPEVPRTASLAAALDALAERRLSVFEDYCDARLASGATSGLAPDLRRYLASHPFREHAWATLMLAEYRRGNVSGALESFNHAATLLRTHLGIDPGPELTELHRAILAHDPRLENPRRSNPPWISVGAVAS